VSKDQVIEALAPSTPFSSPLAPPTANDANQAFNQTYNALQYGNTSIKPIQVQDSEGSTSQRLALVDAKGNTLPPDNVVDLGNGIYDLQVGSAGGTIHTYVRQDPTTGKIQPVQDYNQQVQYTGGQKGGFVNQTASAVSQMPLVNTAVAIAAPEALPYFQALNAVNSANQGNIPGALLSGFNSYTGMTGNNPYLKDQTNTSGLTTSQMQNVNTGLSALNAINQKNPLALANAAMQATGTQLPSELGTGAKIASAFVSLQKGDIAGVMNSMASLTKSQDPKISSSAQKVVEAIQSNDPNTLLTAFTDLSNQVQNTQYDDGASLLGQNPNIVKTGAVVNPNNPVDLGTVGSNRVDPILGATGMGNTQTVSDAQILAKTGDLIASGKADLKTEADALGMTEDELMNAINNAYATMRSPLGGGTQEGETVTDPRTGISTTKEVMDGANVTTITDPRSRTTEQTTENADGSKQVVKTDRVNGTQTISNYDKDNNLIGSETNELGSDGTIPSITIVGKPDYIQNEPLTTTQKEPSNVSPISGNALVTPVDTTKTPTSPLVVPPETKVTPTTVTETPTTTLPVASLPVSTTTPTTTKVTTPTTTPLGGGSSKENFLPMVATMLAGAPVYNEKHALAKLHQLYDSLDPNLAKVLQQAGIIPPEPPREENTTPEENKILASGKQAEPEVAQSFLGLAEGGSALEQANAEFKKQFEKPSFMASTPTMLGAAPVVQQESRLSPLRHLKQGIRRDAPSASLLKDGGLPHKYKEASPEGHDPEFITGYTGYYADGRGTGQSDDIPAMLHEGDYVMDADTVASFGDGSSKAGAQVMDKFHHTVPHKMAVGGNPVPAKIADGEYVFPASFVTALGGGDNKLGSKLLDSMREELRAHKRSAPDTKIPPKAKSPLEYLKMAKG
jgi:hypothetical protein